MLGSADTAGGKPTVQVCQCQATAGGITAGTTTPLQARQEKQLPDMYVIL